MKTIKNLLSLAISLLMAVIIGSAIGFGLRVDPWIPIGILTFAAFVPTGMTGILAMAVQKEIWVNHIIGNLFKNNEFLNDCFVADEYVLQGKVVHIPQAAAAPSVEKNRTSLPATVVKRSDTDVIYALDEFTSDPVLIPNADQYELSYNKRESVLAESEAATRELVAEWMLRNWAPTVSGYKLVTTGGSVAAHTPSATGTRKLPLLADVKKLGKAMDKENIPSEDRYIMWDADMYDQFLECLTATQYRDFSSTMDAAKGIVGELFGFKFMKRSTCLVYDNGLTIYDPGYTGATTDKAAALAWQKNCVERALGTVDFFEHIKDPLYYGDVYSLLIRMGGRKRRASGAGVIALVQDTY